MLFAEQVTRNYTLNQGSQLYEKDASDTKLLYTSRLSKKIPGLASKNIYPNSIPRLIHTIDDDHSNDRYQNIKMRLTGNNFSHRQLHCGIIYHKTYSEFFFLVKLNTFYPEMTNPPLFFYNGSRKAHIIHCKLRLGMSDLNYDLLKRHLTTNSSCDCGERKEISEHYILHCPGFIHLRQNTIFKLAANLLSITTLVQGGPNIYELINKAILDFIAQSGRFAMEWQTQLNSYWHKSILSLSLLIFD